MCQDLVKRVFDEFSKYVGGGFVLALNIYIHLEERLHTETYNDFVLRLFNNGIIRVGNIEAEYTSAMNELQARIQYPAYLLIDG